MAALSVMGSGPIEKLPDTRIRAGFEGVFILNRYERTFVQHSDAIGDAECARYLMGHNQNGHLAHAFQQENQFIQLRRYDGIQTSGGFVEHQDLRVKRDRPRHRCPLLHSPRQLIGQKFASPAQTNYREFHINHDVNHGLGKRRQFAHRQADILLGGERVKECGILKGHSHGASNVFQLFRGATIDIHASNQNGARVRPLEANNVPQYSALPGAAAPKQHHDFIGLNIEVHAIEHLLPIVGDAQVADGDDRLGHEVLQPVR